MVELIVTLLWEKHESYIKTKILQRNKLSDNYNSARIGEYSKMIKLLK